MRIRQGDEAGQKEAYVRQLGAERVAALGGLHRMMDWPGPILTDSGGFQVMSLSKLRKMDADGVTFQSHIDGSRHRLTPERSIDIQRQLDATITMVLDDQKEFAIAQQLGGDEEHRRPQRFRRAR